MVRPLPRMVVVQAELKDVPYNSMLSVSLMTYSPLVFPLMAETALLNSALLLTSKTLDSAANANVGAANTQDISIVIRASALPSVFTKTYFQTWLQP